MPRLPILLAVAGLTGSCYHIQDREVPVWTRELGKTQYLCVNLRSESVFLKSASDLNLPVSLPAGSVAGVEHYGAKRVDLRVHELLYTMYPLDGEFDVSPTGVRQFMEKYFTADSAVARAHESTPAELAQRIRLGEVSMGMTKAQVYTSLGPPRFIEATHIPTVHLPKERIFQSDRWTYTRKVFAELIPQRETYVFDRDVLVKTAP